MKEFPHPKVAKQPTLRPQTYWVVCFSKFCLVTSGHERNWQLQSHHRIRPRCIYHRYLRVSTRSHLSCIFFILYDCRCLWITVDGLAIIHIFCYDFKWYQHGMIKPLDHWTEPLFYWGFLLMSIAHHANSTDKQLCSSKFSQRWHDTSGIALTQYLPQRVTGLGGSVTPPGCREATMKSHATK